MTRNEYENLWNGTFGTLNDNRAMPDYNEFRISERMLEDYLDIFRGINTRQGDLVMPYPHPYFDEFGNPLLKEKPCIKYVLVAEARPQMKPSVWNDCGGDKANTYFYDITHVGNTGYLNSPRISWCCPKLNSCPVNKAQTLMCLASKGVLLLDLFPFAVSIDSKDRHALNAGHFTRSFWDNALNIYNIQARLNNISTLLCKDWDLAMVAPCIISMWVVNPINGFPTLTVVRNPGQHPATFRDVLVDSKRCSRTKGVRHWKKIAVAQQGPSSHLLKSAFDLPPCTKKRK